MTADSDALRERIRKAINSQTKTNINVLSSLLAIQDELSYIPDEAIEEVAIFKGTTINEVWGVASFYPNFRLTPPGAHLVEICWGPTCHLMGAPSILKEVMADLGLDDEGDTDDKNVSMRFNTCLGACAQAPVIMIDHHLMGRASVDSAKASVRKLSDGGH